MNLADLLMGRIGMVVVRLVLIGLGAFFLADITGRVAVSGLDLPAGPVAVPLPEVTRQPNARTVNYRNVVDRNVFNSSPAPPPPPPVRQVEREPIKPVKPEIVFDPVNAKLTGTVVGAAPEDSFAFIMDLSSREEQLYRIGDKVQGKGVVMEIKRDEVRLKVPGGEQYLRLFEEAAPAPPRGASQRGRPSRRTVKPYQGQAPRVESMVIARGEVDEALANLGQILTEARVLPNFEGGKINGFRIFNIKPGSLYTRIGLQNGDVLYRINGNEFNDPTRFMTLFEELKGENNFVLDLSRGRDRRTIEYEIR